MLQSKDQKLTTCFHLGMKDPMLGGAPSSAKNAIVAASVAGWLPSTGLAFDKTKM